MPPDRKKPGLAFWAIVVVVVGLVAYPLSFGPVCWLVNRDVLPQPVFKCVFGPCGYVAILLPESVLTAWGYTCGGAEEIIAAVMLFASNPP
jgi:hypothetical protein